MAQWDQYQFAPGPDMSSWLNQTYAGANPPSWMLPLSLGMGGLGVIGDVMGAANYPQLNLPTFQGGGYLQTARTQMRPELQMALSGSAQQLSQENAALGSLFDVAGMGRSGARVQAAHLAQAGAAQRNAQAYADWQKNITNLAMQLYQIDMQRRIAEYEAAREGSGGGFGGFLSGLGELGAAVLPFTGIG